MTTSTKYNTPTTILADLSTDFNHIPENIFILYLHSHISV